MTRPCATVRRAKASIFRSRTNSASPKSSTLLGFITLKAAGPVPIPRTSSSLPQAKKKKFKNARLAAFGSTRRKGVAVEQDDQVRLLIEAETPVVTIYGKTSMLHVKEVLRCTPEENLAMIADTVKFLKDHGKFVIYDAEHAFDGYKLDPEYALATWQAAEKAGADFVVLCDTNGGCLPDEIAAITREARRQIELQDRHPHARRHRPRASRMRWPRSTPARSMCRAPSTVTANARAIAI